MDEHNDKLDNKIVETYADDMAKVLEDDTGGGLIKKIIHGEEEHEAEKANFSPESKRNKIFMTVGAVLVVLAVAILGFFFSTDNVKKINVDKPFQPLIFTDKSNFVEVSGLSKNEIMQTVLNKINGTEVKEGGIEALYLTENQKVIGLRRLLALIESTFAINKDSQLVSDNFLMGVENCGKDDAVTNREGFFMLIKVRSIGDIFDALRSWEGKMFAELHGFIGVPISSETNYLSTKDFDDGIVGNQNARILHDKDGNVVLMYIFADENSVIITNSNNAAREIMLRLTASQKEQ